MECCICHDSISDSEIISCKQCKQKFHKQCVETWYSTSGKRSCAMCRTNNSFDIKVKTEYWNNDTNRPIITIENNIEKRFWSNGNIKYEIELDNDENILKGTYYTSSNTKKFDIKSFESYIINQIRSDKLYIYTDYQ